MSTESLLSSWNDTPTRSAIVAFVESITTEEHPDFVPVPDRVAVFDNDGTLWTEKPMPIQLDFMIRRFAEQANADPSLQTTQPYQAAFAHDFHWFGAAIAKYYEGDASDLNVLMGAMGRAFAATSIEEYRARADEFFAKATHPTLNRPYLTVHYQPMVELLRYLEANDFMVYIASGGDRDFMRAIGETLYGVPPEQVIGSSQAIEYSENEDSIDLLYTPNVEFFDDGPVKPVRIWSRIGRRPVIACGNSNGDFAMLRFARSKTRPALRLLINHDDADREFDYQSGAEMALERAAERDWTVVSMKNDWSAIFPE